MSDKAIIYTRKLTQGDPEKFKTYLSAVLKKYIQKKITLRLCIRKVG